MDNKEIEVSTQITVKDIQLMKSILESCSSRGVFRANELSIIGSLYDKLVITLKSIVDDENRA